MEMQSAQPSQLSVSASSSSTLQLPPSMGLDRRRPTPPLPSPLGCQLSGQLRLWASASSSASSCFSSTAEVLDK